MACHMERIRFRQVSGLRGADQSHRGSPNSNIDQRSIQHEPSHDPESTASRRVLSTERSDLRRIDSANNDPGEGEGDSQRSRRAEAERSVRMSKKAAIRRLDNELEDQAAANDMK